MKKNEFSNKKVNFFSVLQIFDDFLKDWVKSRKMKRAFSADLKYAYYIFLKNKRHTANLQNSALKILRHFLLKKLSYFWLTNKTQGSVSVFFYSVSKKGPAIHSTQLSQMFLKNKVKSLGNVSSQKLLQYLTL